MKLLQSVEDFSFAGGDVIAMAKADGEYTLIRYFRDDITTTVNRYDNVRTSFPALDEFKRLMPKNFSNIKNGELLCELHGRDFTYNVGAYRPMRLPEFIHNMKSECASKVHIGLFGIVEPQQAIHTIPYSETIRVLEKIALGGKRVHVLPWRTIHNHDELKQYWDEVIAAGWEGLVLRRHDGKIFKVKPVLDCDCVIVGINKKDNKLLNRGEVGSVKLALMSATGDFIEVGSAGGFTNAMKRQLYKVLMQTIVKDDRKTLWVQPRIIIEIKYTEIFKTSKEKKNMNLILHYQGVNRGRLVLMGKVPFYRFRHPRFSRVRSDKTINPTDLRLSQVGDAKDKQE